MGFKSYLKITVISVGIEMQKIGMIGKNKQRLQLKYFFIKLFYKAGNTAGKIPSVNNLIMNIYRQQFYL